MQDKKVKEIVIARYLYSQISIEKVPNKLLVQLKAGEIKKQAAEA